MSKKIKILVTGAAGFMGSHLYDQIFDEGYDVYGVDDLSGGFMHNVSHKQFFTKLDLRDRRKTADYINMVKPEVIFHLAADATEGRSQFTPFSALDRNMVAYMNILVPSIKNGLKKLILTSSMSVYGKQQTPFKETMIPQPEDIYGISKSSMEQITRVLSDVYGFKYVIIRPHNVYGRNQNLTDPYRNVIGIFINSIMHGKPFYIYGDGGQTRAFSYIDDVVPNMILAAFKKECEGQIINIGSDKVTSLKELGEIVLREFFGEDNIPKKLLPKHLPDRPQEVKYAYCDHSKARKLIGFKEKTDLRSGIREMIKWAKQKGPRAFVYLDSLELDHKEIPKTWKNKLI